MSHIINVRDGVLGVDIDALAGHLGVSTSDLKQSMQLLALQYVVNEAERLNAGEQFDKKSKIFPRPPIRDTHLITATRSMLNLNLETGDVK
jgi:hypothetical protein